MALDISKEVDLAETLPRIVVAPLAQKPMKTHLHYIDGMRALAALYVVVHHAFLEIWPDANTQNYFIGLFRYGHFAVSVFIVLSGFSLMIPIARNESRLAGGAVQFYIARARRILPPYYFATGLSLVLIYLFIGQPTGSHWDVSIPVTSNDILYHVLLLQDIYGGAKINHAFWSISVEWHIYIFFPLLVVLHRIGGMLALAAVIITSFVAFVVVGHTTLGSTYWLDSGYTKISLTYFALFGIGMLSAVIAFSPKQRWQHLHQTIPWLPIAGMIALIMWHVNAAMQLPTYVPSYNYFTDLAFVDLLIALVAACLLIAGACEGNNIVKAVIGWKPLAFVGTFAYSIYLIHAPLIHMVWLFIARPLHRSDTTTFVLLVAVGVPLIVACSYGFYLVCERPFVSTKRKDTLAPSTINGAPSPATAGVGASDEHVRGIL